MAYRRVRIYDGEGTSSNVIGFSRSAGYVPHSSDFTEFMSERGYALTRLKWPNSLLHQIRSVSFENVEVRPPMTAEHLQEFGALCVSGLVDPGNDGVVVYDNRQQSSILPYGGGKVVACI